ncbi:MAG: radical SAM protein [Bacillota bacterium]
MQYDMPLYRPPSEADSLILQITLGCSHNKCTFCSMYKTKKYRVLSDQEIEQHLAWAKDYYPFASRIFLADGNALALNTEKLSRLVSGLYKEFPNLERVTAYAGPKDILEKKLSELQAIKDSGLQMLYMGIESGSPVILKEINKGVTPAEMIEAGQKARQAGFKLSCTIILGLGGRDNWREHAVETASVINAIQPEYVGALTLMVEDITPLARKVKNGEFDLLNPQEVLQELEVFISHTQLENCIFRSNHASNYLALKGTLNKDKEKLLELLQEAKRIGKDAFRPEGWRGL